MADIDLVSADPILKQLYRSKKIEDLTYVRRPFYGMIEKFEGFKGRNMPIIVQFGHPQGRSANFQKAQANATAAKFDDFLLTRRKDYSVATVDGETAEATEGDSGAFLSAMAVQIDGALKSLADSHQTGLYRSGTGSIGQVGAVSTNTITLANINDVVNFEPGMKLQANGTDGGTPRAGTEVILGVDRSLGQLTSTNATWVTSITGLVVNDYLLVDGDANLRMTGLDGWIPATKPASNDNFYGVNRSFDSRMYGSVYDGTTGIQLEEAIIDAQSQGAREGAAIDLVLMNPKSFRQLAKGAQSKTQYQRTETTAAGGGGSVARISYSGFLIDGDEGPIKVISDRSCPANVAWALTSSGWTLNSIGPATKILMKDGLRIQRQASSDGYEVRCGFYGNVGCDSPGFNVRISLP